MAKLKLSNGKKFSGVIYGVKFVDGVSTDIQDQHLVERLLNRGYELVKETKKAEEKK